ncbi:MAG: hypothetical protein ABIL09_21660, partial [Gemmatimonadota bacterium]
MRFAAPDNLWLLILVPLLIAAAAWALVARRRALREYAGPVLAARLSGSVSRGRQNARYALFAAGIFFLVWALAGPQFGAHLEMAARRGVDVVVCL